MEAQENLPSILTRCEVAIAMQTDTVSVVVSFQFHGRVAKQSQIHYDTIPAMQSILFSV